MKTVPVTRQDTCYKGANASIDDVSGFAASGITVLRWSFQPEEVAALRTILAATAGNDPLPITILQYCVGNPPTQALLVASGDPQEPMDPKVVIGPLNELAASVQLFRAVLRHTVQPDGTFSRDVRGNQDTFHALGLKALTSKVLNHYSQAQPAVKDVDVTPKKEIVITLSDSTVHVYGIDFIDAFAAGGIDKAL